MPSFAACLYGSALYTPGPRGVRCFVEEGPNSRTYVGADPPVEPRQRVELGDQDVQDASHHRQPLPADPTQVAAKPGFANGIVQDSPPQIGRRILPVGTSLITQLHQQRPQNPLHRPPLGLGAPPSLSPHQVFKLGNRSPSVPLPPQELPVTLIERLKLASAQFSAADRDQQPLAVRG